MKGETEQKAGGRVGINKGCRPGALLCTEHNRGRSRAQGHVAKRHTLTDSEGTCLPGLPWRNSLQCQSPGHAWPQSMADMASATEELAALSFYFF